MLNVCAWYIREPHRRLGDLDAICNHLGFNFLLIGFTMHHSGGSRWVTMGGTGYGCFVISILCKRSSMYLENLQLSREDRQWLVPAVEKLKERSRVSRVKVK